jgi:hypothetical protein
MHRPGATACPLQYCSLTPLACGAAGMRHFNFWEFSPDLPVNFDRILTESFNKLTES